MSNFVVHYQVDNAVYETVVRTDTSYNAISWVLSVFPNAKNATVIGTVDIIS